MAAVDLHSPYPSVVVIPPPTMSLSSFRAWAYSPEYPEHPRITFVRGRVIIDMSPERIDSHNAVKSAINRTLEVPVHEHDIGVYYPDGAWFTNEEAGVSNEPDAAFASWATLESGRLAPPADKPNDGTHCELVGTPDWVCEIVSDSSVDKDTQLLKQAYFQAGVGEYWLIDARGDAIDFQALVRGETSFRPVAAAEGWYASPIFGRQFQLTRVRDRVGRWKYDLAVRDQ